MWCNAADVMCDVKWEGGYFYNMTLCVSRSRDADVKSSGTGTMNDKSLTDDFPSTDSDDFSLSKLVNDFKCV